MIFEWTKVEMGKENEKRLIDENEWTEAVMMVTNGYVEWLMVRNEINVEVRF